MIGQVINALKKNGQYENTLTIFSSDNGGQVNVGGTNGNHRGGKQDMYEGGLKVPTCAVWPGKIKAGTRSNLVGITMDLYPTACAVAGTKVPGYVEGKNILPTMLGQAQTFDRDLVFVRREGGLRYNGQDYHAFRRGDWKLVHNTPFAPYELYNQGRSARVEKPREYQPQKIQRTGHSPPTPLPTRWKNSGKNQEVAAIGQVANTP